MRVLKWLGRYTVVLDKLRQIARRMRGKAPHVPPSPVHELDARDFGWYQAAQRELLPGFRINPGEVVVDVGCGEGGTSCFAAACGASVIAVDIDPEKVDRVEGKLKFWASQPCRAVSNCNPLQLPDGHADCVIAQEVMEHVDNPLAFLAELVRVGKPGIAI